jgi:outer membrane protein assembly factor BamD (BamD/ComL family)
MNILKPDQEMSKEIPINKEKLQQAVNYFDAMEKNSQNEEYSQSFDLTTIMPGFIYTLDKCIQLAENADEEAYNKTTGRK